MGKTRSYGNEARDLGVPEAVRALAGACAANVLADEAAEAVEMAA